MMPTAMMPVPQRGVMTRMIALMMIRVVVMGAMPPAIVARTAKIEPEWPIT
jgi:hypothetical protein